MDVSPPFSFFQYIDKNFVGLPSLRRIFSQARQHGCQTIVVEEIEPSLDIQKENEDLEKLLGDAPLHTTVFRISFFKTSFSSKWGINSAKNEDFIGYVIVKADRAIRDIRVYESVLSCSRFQNNYLRGAQFWTCKINGKKFYTSGYIYAQQNDKTNVCAHVAVRTIAAKYHLSGDMTYREMNNIVGIDHVKRKTGSGRGLNFQEIIKIIESTDARCIPAIYSDPLCQDSCRFR